MEMKEGRTFGSLVIRHKEGKGGEIREKRWFNYQITKRERDKKAEETDS